MIDQTEINCMLISIISKASDTYGDLLIEFMELYDLKCLADASPEQMIDYIIKKGLLSNPEKKPLAYTQHERADITDDVNNK